MSYSGKQWSTHRYSIHDAKPSLSHRWVHHSCEHTQYMLTNILRNKIQTHKVLLPSVANQGWRVWLVTMVTRFPNHWWASSCPTTRATHCLEDEPEFLGSMSRAVSLRSNRDSRLARWQPSAEQETLCDGVSLLALLYANGVPA